MEAFIELPAFDGASPPWPVEAMAPGSWLVLDAGCADGRVGLFLAALADRIEVRSPRGRDETVDALLAAAGPESTSTCHTARYPGY